MWPLFWGGEGASSFSSHFPWLPNLYHGQTWLHNLIIFFFFLILVVLIFPNPWGYGPEGYWLRLMQLDPFQTQTWDDVSNSHSIQLNQYPLCNLVMICTYDIRCYLFRNSLSTRCSVQFSRSVVSNSLRPHESQHARPPCPSPTPGVHSDSRRSSQWCQPSHPLSSPSPPAPNPSQHQSLSQWVNSSHEVAKALKFQL